MEKEGFFSEIEEHCIHGQESPCSCACPFQMDVREFLEKIKKGSFNAAFHLYQEAVCFPDLVWRICPALCRKACGKKLEQSVDIPQLERASMAYARSTAPVHYNLPPKTGTIAVVGSSLSGLSCALRLSALQYQVTVFEREDRVCPGLEPVLDREIFQPAILDQFVSGTCRFCTGEEITGPGRLAAFDAVYLASGVKLEGDGMEEMENRLFASPDGLSFTEEIAAGMKIADEIEWFLKTGSQRVKGRAGQKNRVKTAEENPKSYLPAPGPVPGKGEARQEAGRCTLCDCSACMQECVLIRQYGRTPKDLSRDVGLALNVFPETQGRAGMREIGACNFCGLCRKICPSQIDIGAFLLHSRTELCQKGLLPRAHHDFWMRDMAFSNGPKASVFYQPEETCGYLFFPGCQAGGSDPRYVTMTYEKLLALRPDTALLVHCCGAPALWAGESEVMKETHEKIRAFWQQAGSPVMIVSCPSCYRMFRDYMPEIPVRTVYELPGFSAEETEGIPEAAVFDPCSSRDYSQMQEAVRALAAGSGIRLRELKYAKELAQCCSWGGHGYTVNPLVVKTQAKEQAEMSPLPYITYCTNCRDIFAARGKACIHILDLVNGLHDWHRLPPTVSQRRDNRRALKRQLLERYPVKEKAPEDEIMLKMEMTPQVAAKMNEDLILEEDLSEAIRTCEREGNYLIDTDTGHRICHMKIGYITYWTEYSVSPEGGCMIYNAYSHRMQIKEEYHGCTGH